MRILLPPSEAKNPGGRGRALSADVSIAASTNRPGTVGASAATADGRAGALAALTGYRQEVLAALAALVDQPAAAESLLLPPSVAEAALAANRRAGDSPTLPAIRRYAGVVYDGLDIAGLSPAAQRRARTDLLIFSGLLGLSRGGDPVPDYRVPAKATLPGIGVAGTFWRPRLTELMPAFLDRGPLIDLRSSDYAAMWQPKPGSTVAARLIGVRVLSRTPAGRLAVVSYPSKLAKGRLAAALLERQAAGLPVAGAEDVLAAWAQLGGRDGSTSAGARGLSVELIE